jgi:tetratricopeptide (TPR) repeat protein
MILNGQGTTLWNFGKLQEAIEAFAEALVIYRALNLPRLEARALNNMGIVFAALGEFEEALSHYKSALKLDQALGDRSGIALKLGNIGQTYADLGDTERAEAYLSKALKLAEQMGDASSTADAVISLGQVRLARGEHDEALELFERGLELATENRERYQEIRALIYLALTQVEGDRPAEGALELARSATELARKMPMPVGVVYGHAVQGLALARLDRFAEAADASAEAVRLQGLDDQSMAEGAEQILWIHARLCEAAGRTADAGDAWRRARAEVTKKASKLHDEALKKIYLASRVPAAVLARTGR